MLSKELISKLEAIGKNEEIISKFQMAETEEEAKEIMKEIDLNFTDDEKEQIFNLIGEDGELSVDALDMISGGIVWSSVYLACFGIGMGFGMLRGMMKKAK